MRKSLAILIIITLLSGYGIYWANATIGAEVDDVQFKEHAIYGDKSVVDGVTVQRNTKYEEYMYWDTTYTIGDSPKVDIDFQFYEFGKVDGWERYYSGIWLENYWLTTDYIDENMYETAKSENLRGLDKALYELVEEAPAGKQTNKNVELKDYAEYYTFGMQVELPYVYWDYTSWSSHPEASEAQYSAIMEKFCEFFKIPVLEDERYTIAVNKDENGKVIGYGCASSITEIGVNDYDYIMNPVQSDSFLFEIDAAYTEETCYFTFTPRSIMGKLVDTSLIPGGYGIYSFKYDSKKGTFDADSLKLEYALEPKNYVSLKVDAQQENLLVFTDDGTQFEMQVVALETMEQKQVLNYGKVDEENLTRCYFVYEDYLIAQYDYYEAMIFSRNTDGTYNAEYTIPAEVLEASEEAYFLSGDCSFDWDGEKLLVADSLETGEPHYQDLCGFFLAAFDKTGLVYYGEYESSLDTGSLWHNNGLCEPTSNEPLTISWK